MKKYLGIFMICLLSLSWAVDKTGSTAAKFLSIGAGSRAIGMGGAFTSIANDASAMYWNPAGIARLNRNEFLVNHTRWLADIWYDYLGVTIRPMPDVVLGFNITAVTMGEMDVTRYGNEETGETFKAGSWAFGVTFATNLTDRFSIGFNGKFIREYIANNNASGFALDVGTLFDTPFGFRLGASISNFGPKMQMRGIDLLYPIDIDPGQSGENQSVVGQIDTDKFDLPLLLRVGISDDIIMPTGTRFTWSVDANHPNDNSEYVNAGLEMGLLNEMVFLRAGSKTIFINDREERLTLGAGLKYSLSGMSVLVVDYAYETTNRLGNVHKFTLSLNY